MNISFFLKPKVEVSYLTESCPVQKAIDDMLHSGFTAIPVVDAKGKYAGTITEGDFLRLVLHYPSGCDHLPLQASAELIQRSSSRYVSSLSGCPTTAREAFERSNTRRARFRISSAVTRS